jgi:hypothetical protein
VVEEKVIPEIAARAPEIRLRVLCGRSSTQVHKDLGHGHHIVVVTMANVGPSNCNSSGLLSGLYAYGGKCHCPSTLGNIHMQAGSCYIKHDHVQVTGHLNSVVSWAPRRFGEGHPTDIPSTFDHQRALHFHSTIYKQTSATIAIGSVGSNVILTTPCRRWPEALPRVQAEYSYRGSRI